MVATPSSTIAKPNAPLRDFLRLGSSSSTRGNPSTRGALAAGRGKGATRGGSTLAPKNVFTASEPPKKKRTLLEVSADPTKEKKHYGNMRIRRKAELQARSIADGAPDLSALPGGLFDPSKPSTYQPIRPADLRRTPSTKLPEDSDMGGLFVDSDEYLENEPMQGGSSAAGITQGPPTQTAVQPHPNPNLAVCFYWNRGQKDQNSGSCTKGYECSYLHEYLSGVPVAPAPPGYMERTNRLTSVDKASIQALPADNYNPQLPSAQNPWGKPATCYFWDRGQRDSAMGTCNKGDDCKFLHAYLPGLRVAYPPGDHVEPRNDLSVNMIPVGQPPPERSVPTERPTSRIDSLDVDMPQNSPVRPPWQREGPDRSICYYWHDTGSCPSRETCKFLHTNAPHVPVAPRPIDAMKRPILETERAVESEVPRRNPPSPKITQSTPVPPSWQPTDPYKATCWYWRQSSGCNKGSYCRYLHEAGDDIPLAPPPPSMADRKLQTCRFWAKGMCDKSDERCPFLHRYPETSASVPKVTESRKSPEDLTSALIVPTGPRKSVSFADEPMPFFEEHERHPVIVTQKKPLRDAEDEARLVRSKHDKGICFRWAEGTCYHGSSCKFNHEYAPGEDPMDLESNTEPQRSPIKDPHSQPRSAQPSTLNANRFEHQISNGANNQKGPRIESPFEQSQVDTSQPASTPGHPSGETPKVKRAAMKPGDHNWKATLKAQGPRAKEVIFGAGENHSVILDFGDLNQVSQHSWAQALTALSRVQFDQLCIAQDIAPQLGLLQSQVFWQGNLAPADATDTQASSTVSKVIDELRLRSSGLVHVSPEFIILLYPRTDEWSFIEPADSPKDMRLRYLIFHSEFDIRKSDDKAKTSEIKKLPPGEPFPYRKALVKKIHGLHLKTLLPVFKDGKQNPYNFYLLFPPTASQTADFIASWLLGSYRQCRIYSSQVEGSWDFFLKSPRTETGVVFIHESAASDIYRLPSFLDLVKRSVNFWFISDSSAPYPMFPSSWDIPDDLKLGQITAARLLPHGHVILLTPSFVVAEPLRTLELLEWFFGRPGRPATDNEGAIPKRMGKLENSTPGTWKLLSCHNLPDYLLDVANAKAIEKRDFETANRNKPQMEAMIEDMGLSFATCKVRYKLHALLIELESRSILNSSSDEYDSDFPDEIESPIVYADRYIDPDMEEALVEWFAAWSLRKLDLYRKFTVIGTGPRSAPRAMRIKEVPITSQTSAKELTEAQISSLKSFSIAKKQSQSPRTSTPHHSESPMSPHQKALAAAAKITASHVKSLLSNSRIAERNPFDDLTYVASPLRSHASSPRPPSTPTAVGKVVGSLGSYSVALSKESPTKPDDGHMAMGAKDLGVTKHGIDQLPPECLNFIGITGADADDAKRFLSQADNDIQQAVQLYESRNANDPIGTESQALGLIASAGNVNHQQIPRLATADTDTARAMDLYGSLPSVSVPPKSAVTNTTSATTAFFSPQYDGTFDGYFPGQIDGAGDERPVSSGTESNKSSTSRSGIQTGENGQRFVPRSLRTSGSVRREIPVKPGYIPPEDRDVYRVRRIVDGVPQFEGPSNTTSKTGSKISSPVPVTEEIMEIDSVPMTTASKDEGEINDSENENGVSDVKTVWKEVKFEPTTTWYKRLRDNGGGWEHLYVESHDKVFVSLGIHRKAA
jgi:chromo domain-containing protein 1